MIDELERCIANRFAETGPSPAAAAGLAEALATAEQAPADAARRAWRARAAIAAAVVVAVGAGLAYVRIDRGEVRGKGDGAAAPLDGRTVRVRVGAEGAAVLEDLEGRPRARFDLGGSAARASDGLVVLERALGEIASATPRDPDGTSSVALEVVSNGNANWRWTQWILQAAAAPDVRIAVVRLGSERAGEAAIEQRLPSDHGPLEPGVAGEQPARVVVAIEAGVRAGPSSATQPGGATIRLRAMGASWIVDLPSSRAPIGSGAVGLDRAIGELSIALRATAGADGTRVGGEIAGPPPGGDGVTYEVAVGVLRAFRQAGIDDVQFEGAPSPRAAGPSSPR